MFVCLSKPSIVHFLSSPLFWPSHHSQTASTQLCWFLLFAVPLLSQVLHLKLPVPWVCPGKSCIVISSTNLFKCTHCSRVGSCLRDCMIASHPWSSGSIPPPRSSHTDSETKSVFHQNHFDVHCSPFPAARSKSKSSSFASTTMGWPGLSLNLIRPVCCIYASTLLRDAK